MPERDPLEMLQEAWQQLDAPPAARELHEEDAATQEAVNWMAQAWQQVEIPAVELPRRKPVLQFRRWALPGAAAVAAALLISSIILLNPRPQALDSDNATNIAVDRPEVPVDPKPVSPKPASPKLIANTPEKVEILTGRVRLTMLRGSSASTEQNSEDY